MLGLRRPGPVRQPRMMSPCQSASRDAVGASAGNSRGVFNFGGYKLPVFDHSLRDDEVIHRADYTAV